MQREIDTGLGVDHRGVEHRNVHFVLAQHKAQLGAAQNDPVRAPRAQIGDHRQEGRAFVYRPCVAEHEAGRSEVRHVLSRFFGNSRERLLLSLLGDEEISAEELRRLKEAIQNAAEDGLEGA